MTGQTEYRGTIGFLGAGKMATALGTGIARASVVPADRLLAADLSPDALSAFAQSTGGTGVETNRELVQRADVIFLAIKPQHMDSLLDEIKQDVTGEKLIVSIAAGVRLHDLERELPAGSRVIRVMPNTPALVGAGASAFSCGDSATQKDRELVAQLLSTVGCVEDLPERLLDAVTGLSGSGPAYVYQFIEALSDGGVKMGLPRATALKLAAQTVFGAAKMVLETGEHPGALKDAVTSPGGTTIAGLHALEQGGLRGVLMDAVEAATLRSEELG